MVHRVTWWVLMERLAEATLNGRTSPKRLARRALPRRLHRRSLIVVLSDLFDPDPEGLQYLLSLRARGSRPRDPPPARPDGGSIFLSRIPQLFLSMEDDRKF